MNDDDITLVRRFNQVMMRRINALHASTLSSDRPLAEARLLLAIGREGGTVRCLRERLGLDSGYLSRILRSLEQQGLVRSRPDDSDARVRQVALTPQGEAALAALDSRAREQAGLLLEPLSASQRRRLLAAMAEVEGFLRASAVTIELADPAGHEAQACIAAYFDELRDRLDGGFEPSRSTPADPDGLVPPAGWFLLARAEGRAIGCAALRVTGPAVGEIKRMWVAPSVRGLGIAQRLLDSLERQAVAAGLDTLQLDTNQVLTEARALYARNGYQEIAAYNSNPYAHYWFEKRGLQNGRVGL